MENFLSGFSAWFNSRKTKTFLVVVLSAGIGYLNHSITPEQALNTLLIAGIALILGVTAEDVAGKINAGKSPVASMTVSGDSGNTTVASFSLTDTPKQADKP